MSKWYAFEFIHTEDQFNVGYEIKRAAGKGRGVFATDDIHIGDVVCESDPIAFLCPTPSMPITWVVQSLPGVSDVTKQRARKLLPTDGSLMDKFNINAFDIDHADGKAKVLYLRPSMFNHDSEHNCTWSIDRTTLQMTVVATQSVQAGEELTVHYGQTPEQLKKDYGFESKESPVPKPTCWNCNKRIVCTLVSCRKCRNLYCDEKCRTRDAAHHLQACPAMARLPPTFAATVLQSRVATYKRDVTLPILL